MSKYVPKVQLGKCQYDKCTVPYRAVMKGEGAILVYEDDAIRHYHCDCYVKMRKEKSNARDSR